MHSSSINQLFLVNSATDKLELEKRARNNMNNLGIGERIKKLRETNGLTQVDLAKMLKITHQSISKWEREDSIPDTLMIVELSKTFSVPTDYLLLGKTKNLKESKHDNSPMLKVESIEELSHEELLILYSDELVKDMSDENRCILQDLGFISICSNPEWTVEGKQLSDGFWYNCCEAILKEIKDNRSIEDVYLNVNRQIDVPRKLFNRFVDDLVAIGRIPRISQLFQKS